MDKAFSTTSPGDTTEKRRRLARLVISIVVLSLVAFFLRPVFLGVIYQFKGKQPQAAHTAMQLQQAIFTYLTEYGKFPVNSALTSEAETLASTEEFMAPLLGDWPESRGYLSPRSITFFSGRRAEKNWRGKYHSGLHILESGGIELLDNWGNHYQIRLDLDGDGKIPDPTPGSNGAFIERDVIVWSFGRDGKDDSAGSDDITTW